METLRPTNKYGLNHAVRIHEFTRKGTVAKRPCDPRTFRVQGMFIERGMVFYSLRCEADGHEIPRYSESCLSETPSFIPQPQA